MPDKTNLTTLDFGDPDGLRSALDALKRTEEIWIEYQQIWARIRRASFEAHIEAGFLEAEALELCKQVFVT